MVGADKCSCSYWFSDLTLSLLTIKGIEVGLKPHVSSAQLVFDINK